MSVSNFFIASDGRIFDGVTHSVELIVTVKMGRKHATGSQQGRMLGELFRGLKLIGMRRVRCCKQNRTDTAHSRGASGCLLNAGILAQRVVYFMTEAGHIQEFFEQDAEGPL